MTAIPVDGCRNRACFVVAVDSLGYSQRHPLRPETTLGRRPRRNTRRRPRHRGIPSRPARLELHPDDVIGRAGVMGGQMVGRFRM